MIFQSDLFRYIVVSPFDFGSSWLEVTSIYKSTAYNLTKAVLALVFSFWCKYCLRIACEPLILLDFFKSYNFTPTTTNEPRVFITTKTG